ncbi:precorrin-8W decarboxylase [Asticcacaulis sp. AC460]|uniref:capsid scaffolding protein n=1 Tax=Asticcacaulis sp. AC460 TaxID=1282360 RepID=UPI0003C3AF50|nr:capsid scaffolding protein [Asticcacaulis sp. AC460]ESQ89993.1 precorrin-8W decarboxylase [Asticcacaulis sp. AC460]
MKPKKFRVAVSGPTIDGRTIEPNWLREAAETFNPNTYGVRVNVEHIRGISGDKPFGMVGDVVGLSVQEDTLQIGGKPEKRTCLYAEILPNDRAKDLNKADQKVYTSIELYPDFAKTGKYGLTGIAVTDTPASIGTERLQFSKAFATVPTDPHEHDSFKFDEDKPTETQNALTIALSSLSAAVTALTGGNKEVPKVEVITPNAPAPQGLELFAAGMQAQADATAALAKSVTESFGALRTDLDTQRRDFDALKAIVEKTPDASYTQRPAATGGDGRVLAVC